MLFHGENLTKIGFHMHILHMYLYMIYFGLSMVIPLPSSSDHQDYSIFSRESL